MVKKCPNGNKKIQSIKVKKFAIKHDNAIKTLIKKREKITCKKRKIE